jgi:hypothetical protein
MANLFALGLCPNFAIPTFPRIKKMSSDELAVKARFYKIPNQWKLHFCTGNDMIK